VWAEEGTERTLQVEIIILILVEDWTVSQHIATCLTLWPWSLTITV